MTTEARIQVTSSELGSLWMTYMSTSARLVVYGFFKEKTIDKEAQDILASYIVESQNVLNKVVNVFNYEKSVIPIGYDEHDVLSESPPLFDDFFHIMFLRQMMKLNFGYNAVFSAYSYMDDVNDILKLNYDISNKYYMITTKYLLGKGVLARPPYINMPKKVEFIENKNYMSASSIFSQKRSLNTVEVGYIYEAVEDNIFVMQLMTGFAQVASESEVKQYLMDGRELTKKNISILSKILLDSDIQPPSTWAGKATESINSPFSDNLMMYIISLFSTTALGFTALGTSFSMRNDLPVKLALISKDTFAFAKRGAKIMIKHKWMEEPPQMEDRNQLSK